MTVLGLLKSGKWILGCTSDRGDPMKLLGERHEKFDLVSLRGNPSWWNRAIRCEWGHASWQTGATWYRFSKRGMASTIRHWKRWSRIEIVSRIKIIRESVEWTGSKKTEKNFKRHREWSKYILWLGDCSWLLQWNQKYSWERVTWTIVNPLWTLQIPNWNKSSTHQQDWCLNKMRSRD